MLVFQELARKAQEDWLDDDAIKKELQEIYALAEAGKISSQDFEARECRLLERLEQIARAKFNDKWGQAEASGPLLIDASPVIDAIPVVVTTPMIETPPPIPPSLPPPPPLAPPAPPAPPAMLSIGQVVESTTRALALLNLKLSVVTSVSPDDGGWHVTAELVERRGVPDTNDLIGVYELRLDSAGSVTRYERTRLRRRGDIGR